jgi:hypothetical protein
MHRSSAEVMILHYFISEAAPLSMMGALRVSII